MEEYIKLRRWRTPPETPKNFSETIAADVVVIGAGLSGLCAARRAAELGMSVVVLESDSTWDVHGYQCAAFNPKMLTDHGIEEDFSDFVNAYARQHLGRSSEALISLWARESGKAFDWFEDILPPAGNNPDTDYRSVLYLPRPPQWKEVRETEAWTQFLGSIDFTYASFHHAGKCLADYCQKLGCAFRYLEAGYMLTQNEQGRVDGVVSVNTNGEYRLYRAGKGVVLATGTARNDQDVTKELELQQLANSAFEIRNLPKPAEPSGRRAVTVQQLGSSAQKMAVWVGAELNPWVAHDYVCETLLGPTPGVSINNLGKRWRNEDAPIWLRGSQLLGQPSNYGWEIYDANWKALLPYTSCGHRAIDPVGETPNTIPSPNTHHLADGTPVDGKMRYEDCLEQDILAGVGNPNGVKFGNYVKRPGTVFAANTLEELADMIGFCGKTKEIFLQEIVSYNEICKAGLDSQYGKRKNLLHPVCKAPFIACGAGLPGKGGCSGNVGVCVNDNMQAMDASGEPIEGLYCAGAVVGGRDGSQYMTTMSGMNHGFCITFGKLAAEGIAHANNQ